MALNEWKRLAPAALQADENNYIVFLEFEGYQPADPACARENLRQLRAEMQALREQQINLANALAAAQDAARTAEWRFHNAMLDVKAQVIAQYGVDSDEVQALGLKKRCERRKPGRRSARSEPD